MARARMGGARGPRAPKTKGAWTRRFAGRYPFEEWGAARLKRGTPGTLALFGPSYAEANPDQRANRKLHIWYGKGMYGGAGLYTGRGKYRGKGAFWDDLKRSYGNVAGRLGAGTKAALTAIGQGGLADRLTQAEGIARGMGLHTAMGMGSYTAPVMNDIVNGGGADVVPSFKAGADNSVVITHREYVTDIYGPEAAGTFQNTPFSINPALERTFPWLSQVAQNYEEYTIKQLIFTFRTSMTDFVSTNGQVGTIIMATQYNPSDQPFTSKQDAMEYDLAQSSKISVNMLHGVECDPRLNSGAAGKYTRAGPVSHGQDLKQYDLGNLNVCISNIPQEFINQALGELHVSYTIELRKPKFFVTRGLGILRDVFAGYTGGTTAAAALEDVPIYALQGNQNRIGGRLDRVIDAATGLVKPNMFTYTFPTNFSGSVRMQLTAQQTVALGNTWSFKITPAATVAIAPITDVWGTGSAWVNTISPVQAVNALGPVVGYADYSISTPTSAGTVVDNSVTFEVNGYGGSAPVQMFREFTLDVSLLNTAFNYTPKGPLMLDSAVTGELQALP